MKLLPLDLEMKVLLTAVGICVFGILRMTHLVHLSDHDDIMMLFLLGIILTGFLIRSPRFSSASNAVSCLCFGLLLSAPIKSSNSIFENCLDGLILILWGLGFLVFTAAAIKDFRKARREEVPESHLAD